MTPYRITGGARQDALDAEDRLESEHAGYGPAFADEFRRGVLAAASQPLNYPKTFDGPRRIETREYFIRRFNYRLIYAFDGAEVVFLAVQHAARRPGTWRHRLRDLN